MQTSIQRSPLECTGLGEPPGLQYVYPKLTIFDGSLGKTLSFPCQSSLQLRPVKAAPRIEFPTWGYVFVSGHMLDRADLPNGRAQIAK
jgi:hypothetical protein